MAHILRTNGSAAPEILVLNLGTNRVGSDSANHFCLSHPSVSKHHCDFIVTAEALLLRDRDSARGTFVDGKRIKRAVLQAGQVVRVGRIEFVVEETKVRVAIPLVEPVAGRSSAPIAPIATKPAEVFICVRHPEAPVKYRCTKCRAVLCKDCVSILKRSGGKTHILRSLCTQSVELIWR